MVGLIVHSKTRKKSLVEKLANEGLSILFKWAEEIKSSIAKQLCFNYSEDAIVCPALEYCFFKTAAINNIDHNLLVQSHSFMGQVFQFSNI